MCVEPRGGDLQTDRSQRLPTRDHRLTRYETIFMPDEYGRALVANKSLAEGVFWKKIRRASVAHVSDDPALGVVHFGGQDQLIPAERGEDAREKIGVLVI